jgi:hypothetical protein
MTTDGHHRRGVLNGEHIRYRQGVLSNICGDFGATLVNAPGKTATWGRPSGRQDPITAKRRSR